MSFECFREVWSAANSASDLFSVEKCWEPDGTFVPSDGAVVLQGSTAIATWMLRRPAAGAAALQLVELSSWRSGNTLVAAAMQTTTMDSQDGAIRRTMTILAAVSLRDGAKLRHVAEAAPAVLPQVIAAYKAQARLLFS